MLAQMSVRVCGAGAVWDGIAAVYRGCYCASEENLFLIIILRISDSDIHLSEKKKLLSFEYNLKKVLPKHYTLPHQKKLLPGLISKEMWSKILTDRNGLSLKHLEKSN